MEFDQIRMGKILRDLRGSMSLAEVAKKVGVSVSAMCMYESGQRVPRDQVKVALANFYNRPVSYIFFGE